MWPQDAAGQKKKPQPRLKLSKVANHSDFGQSSHLGELKLDSVIKTCQGSQRGDPESPAFFSVAIQDLTDEMESKINSWHLDDEHSNDKNKTVFKIFGESGKQSWAANQTLVKRLFSWVISPKSDDQ